MTDGQGGSKFKEVWKPCNENNVLNTSSLIRQIEFLSSNTFRIKV